MGKKQNKTWVYTESPILSVRIQKGEHSTLHISTKISSYTSLMMEIDKIKRKIPIEMKAIIIFVGYSFPRVYFLFY